MNRGRLRIYLSCAPGAGAICALRGEGHQRAAYGTDVVVACARTRGRPHPAGLLAVHAAPPGGPPGTDRAVLAAQRRLIESGDGTHHHVADATQLVLGATPPDPAGRAATRSHDQLAGNPRAQPESTCTSSRAPLPPTVFGPRRVNQIAEGEQ